MRADPVGRQVLEHEAGVGGFFERPARAGHARLSADGVFVQWMQAYEVDAPTLKTVFATFASVFEHVEVWQTLPGDLMLVGAKRPIVYRGPELARRIAEEPFRSALRSAWRAVDLHGVLAHFIADDKTVRMLAADRDVLGVGVETIGTDAGQAAKFDPPFPNHNIMHGHGKLGLASLCNLDRLPPTGAVLIAAPLKLVNGSGSPVRAVALVPA